QEPRPKWFRRMARHILAGLQKAQVVFHSTSAVREQIVRHGIVDPSKLVQAPCGIAPEFTNDRATKIKLPSQLPDEFILHVGSCIPRKRIDVLLDVFAEVRKAEPNLHLIQLGGEWSDLQSDQIRRLGIA